jgi:hypothetical protein
MKSQWYEYKEAATLLRVEGISMTVIEQKLGIPRSTLSGWFKDIKLTVTQKQKLEGNKKEALRRARLKANEWHRNQKALRLLKARQEALETLQNIELNRQTLDLAFAMLYLGEGAKNSTTSLASSNPKILLFVLKVLEINYSITPEMIRCELHLRADQDPSLLKKYWSVTLNIPEHNFSSVMIDKRTEGKKTYDHYKGVCVLYCRDISIQRKLIYLYELFCDKVCLL